MKVDQTPLNHMDTPAVNADALQCDLAPGVGAAVIPFPCCETEFLNDGSKRKCV